MISGTGDYDISGGFTTRPWVRQPGIENKIEIKTATVHVKEITNLSMFFGECTELESVDLSGLNASMAETMASMFSGCTSLKEVKFGDINTSNVTNMYGMFKNCSSLVDIDLSALDVQNAKEFGNMFEGCSKLETVEFGQMNTEKLENTAWMFSGCSSLKQIDISGLDMTLVQDTYAAYNMFQNCNQLVHVEAPAKMGPREIVLPDDSADTKKWHAYNKGTDAGAQNIITAAYQGMVFARADGKTIPSDVHTMKIDQPKDCGLVLVSGSGNQPYIDGQMQPIVYQVQEGYYIPEDYVSKISGLTNGTMNGVTVVRNDATKITISGTPTGDVAFTLNPATKKTPLTTPSVTVDYENGVLTGFKSGVTYKINGKTVNPTGEPASVPIAEEYYGTDISIVQVCNETEALTMTDSAPQTVKIASKPATTETEITSKTDDSDLAGASFGKLKARASKNEKKSITLKWNKVKDADGYIVYGNRCNSGGKKYKCEKITTLSKDKTTYKVKKLEKGRYYKFIVVAYKNVDGKQVILTASPTIHSTTKGGKFGVAKSVKIDKIGTKKNTTKITLKKGKTAKIKAHEVKESKKISHHRNLVFESSNKNVATVTKNGKIKAEGKGKCKIYVYAQNGVYKTINVTVK